MSGFRFKGSLMRVQYPKLYNMTHLLALNVLLLPKDLRIIFIILLYKGLKGKARIPTDDLLPKNRRGRNQHSLAFQIPSASKEAYKSCF